MGIFERLDMQVVGFWTPENITVETGDLVYLMAFVDTDEMGQKWETFRADPEWNAGYTASRVDGPLVARVVSTVILPTDFSPMK